MGRGSWVVGHGAWGRFCVLVAAAAYSVASGPAGAHEEEYLGHHWSSPEYLAEIHFQLAFMVAAIAAVVVWALISRRRRARRCG